MQFIPANQENVKYQFKSADLHDLQPRGFKKLAEENSKPWILLFAKSENTGDVPRRTGEKSVNISPVLFFLSYMCNPGD